LKCAAKSGIRIDGNARDAAFSVHLAAPIALDISRERREEFKLASLETR